MLGIVIVVVVGIVLFHNPKWFGSVCSKAYNGISSIPKHASSLKPHPVPKVVAEFKEGFRENQK